MVGRLGTTSRYTSFKRVDISALSCSALSERHFCTYFITAIVQHFNCNSTKHPCSDHTAYCKWSCFRRHCTCRTWLIFRGDRGNYTKIIFSIKQGIIILVLCQHFINKWSDKTSEESKFFKRSWSWSLKIDWYTSREQSLKH